MQVQHIICQDLRLLALVLDDYLVLCMEYGGLVTIPIYLRKNIGYTGDCTRFNVQRKVCLTF
jgi:hypothetical protein